MVVMDNNRDSRSRCHHIVAGVLGFAVATIAAGDGACFGPDNQAGTVDLPAACDYTAPQGVMLITGGMPAGTTIRVEPRLADFMNVVRFPGGILNGEVQQFDATLYTPMTGTGLLANFNRMIFIPVTVEIHTAPRNPGDPVQSFSNEMFILQGQLNFDPDFDFLSVKSGAFFGLPGPGDTTLTRTAGVGSDFVVDSFFDIFYEMDFEGAAGSVLDGYGGPNVDGPLRLQQGKAVGCPWDCGGDNDNNVGIVDFLALLAQWGDPGPCDFDGDGEVGITDFLELLANWGPCGGLHPACFPASGNCFVVNETPGCDLAFCCAIVCGIDPLCCDVEWDADCVQLAGVNCAM
jgi:hypothetical protein